MVLLSFEAQYTPEVFGLHDRKTKLYNAQNAGRTSVPPSYSLARFLMLYSIHGFGALVCFLSSCCICDIPLPFNVPPFHFFKS